MPRTTTTDRQVDVGALAGAIRNDATKRVAIMLEAGFEACAEDGAPLGQLQRAELVQWAIDQFDGFERSVASELVADLTSAGVAVWGLQKSLADLLPTEGDDA